MSDYLLNKIYDSLLSNKPVSKKPEPIVEKKKTFKTLSQILDERYEVMFKKDTDSEFTKMEVDDAQFQKAYRYLQVTDTELQEAIKELMASGLVKHHIQMIERLVFAHDNPKNFYNAIKNKVTIEELLQHTDIVTFISNRFNLSKEVIADLLTFVPPGTPSLGKGEIFFILFVQGASKGQKIEDGTSQSGDVIINGQEYELKGTGARIKGQHGFGSHDTARMTWEEELQKLINQAGLVITAAKQDYDINKEQNGFINLIAKQLIDTQKVTRDDIINVYVKGYKRFYLLAPEDEIRNWVNKGLDNNGIINNEFRNLFFKFALRYYASQERFNYIIVLGTDPTKIGQKVKGGGRRNARYGMQKTVSRQEIESGNIDDKIAIDKYPSFKERAGQGAGVFSIKFVL